MATKPSQNEDEYFVKRDAEIIKQRRRSIAEEAEEAEQRSHLMKCPKCGVDLVTREYHSVDVERCPDCGGLWIGAAEVESLIENRESEAVSGFFRSLFHKARGSGSSR